MCNLEQSISEWRGQMLAAGVTSPVPLDELESQSIYILREAFYHFEHLAMLWSIGKDSSVMLWLARKAFFGHVPFPLIHIDTHFKIPEMIEYRDRLTREWRLTMIVGVNQQALAERISLVQSPGGDEELTHNATRPPVSAGRPATPGLRRPGCRSPPPRPAGPA